MQRIVIENFGPIKKVDMPIHDFTVLIGPQASGKSTIAKLVFFFHWIEESILKQAFPLLFGLKSSQVDLDKIVKTITNQFAQIFPLASIHSDTKLLYYHIGSSGVETKLSIENHSGTLEFNGIGELLENTIQEIKNDPFFEKHSKILEAIQSIPDLSGEYLKELGENINKSGERILVYIPAERIIISAMPQLLRSRLLGGISALSSQQAIYFDWFVSRYFEQRDKALVNFSNKASDFHSALALDSFQEELKEKGISLIELIEKVVKGKYLINKDQIEFLRVSEKKKISLDQTSSGQQQSLIIFLELFQMLWENKAMVLFIEEPESHLYPAAQQSMVEAIALAFNSVKGNSTFITTHSPYILTAFDNLITASQVAKIGEKELKLVQGIVPEAYWLDFEKVGVYFLKDGKLSTKYENDKSSGIINFDREGIGESELDDVSENIGDIFDRLLEIKYANEKVS